MREAIVEVDDLIIYRTDGISTGGVRESVLLPLKSVKDELIRCKDCKYLNEINSNAVYARCEKHGIEFLPFEDDTRECFCSWAERIEE